MPIDPTPAPVALLWTGRVLSGLTLAFVLMDGAMKLVPIKPVHEAMAGLGFASSDALARGLGLLLIACALLHAWPRTALVGAILMTGYLGGAIAVQLRVGAPLFSHVLFGAYTGLALLTGLLLRSPAARAALFP